MFTSIYSLIRSFATSVHPEEIIKGVDPRGPEGVACRMKGTLMANLLRRSYALSPELVERIYSLAMLLSDQGLALSDGAIVRMALDKGLPLVEQILTNPEEGVLLDESIPTQR